MIKSQDELTEAGGRQSDVLIKAIEKCEKLEKQLKIAVKCLEEYANESIWLTGYDNLGNGGSNCMFYCDGFEYAQKALAKIKELDK